MPTPPCPICIEMVQYTPRRDGMTLQISATDPAHPLSPLIGQSRQIQTRQRTIAGDDEATLASVSWSDDNVDAAAVEYFAALGIAVTVTPNYLPSDAPTEERPVDTAPIDPPIQETPPKQDPPVAQEPPP